jgi:hypothetical protein
MTLQWCELCRELVQEVSPCCCTGKQLIMACPACLKHFPDKIQAQWGRYDFQFYWDLGRAPLPAPQLGKKKIFHAYLKEYQVALLRASGYELQKEITDESDDDAEEADEGNVCVRGDEQ